MYYVYGLINPLTNKIFYIGKGSGDRYKYHYTSKFDKDSNKHKVNTIKQILNENLIPSVHFFNKNIKNEKTAYKIEEIMIELFGLDNLTNICLSANPPNHKGKTYEEIMGKEKAEELRKRKSLLQKEAGGYGPSKHTKETKEKISKSQKNRPPFSKETLEKMSKSMMGKNLGKRYSDEINKKKGSPGEKNGMYGKKHKKYKCEYCTKEVALHLLNRWHNDNCKENKNVT